MSSSNPSLTSVALNVVEQYEGASRQLLQACSSRVRRESRRIHERVSGFVESRRVPLLNDAVKFSLLDAESKAWGLVDKSIAFGCDRMDELTQRVARDAKQGLKQFASALEAVESAVEGAPKEVLTTLGLPGAQMSLAVATSVASGASALSSRIEGEQADEPVAGELVVAPARAPRGRRSRG